MTLGVQVSTEQKIRAEFSRMKDKESIDAWGMSRATGVSPLEAERLLDMMVLEGTARKEGVWYSAIQPVLPE